MRGARPGAAHTSLDAYNEIMPLDVSREFYEDWEYFVFKLRWEKESLNQEGIPVPPLEAWPEFARLYYKWLRPGEFGKRTPTELTMLLTEGMTLAMYRSDWGLARSYSDLALQDERFGRLDQTEKLSGWSQRVSLEVLDGDLSAALRFTRLMLGEPGHLAFLMARGGLMEAAAHKPEDIAPVEWTEAAQELLRRKTRFVARAKKLVPGVSTLGDIERVLRSTL